MIILLFQVLPAQKASVHFEIILKLKNHSKKDYSYHFFSKQGWFFTHERNY
jgi:hypothetical protein